MSIKSHIRKMALNWGVEINRFNPSQSPQARLQRQLATNRVDLVIDVGANNGGFARYLREAGYQGQILSFEPLETAHIELSLAAAKDARWDVAPKMALGSLDGHANINLSGNSTSSSLLPMLESHISAAPNSRYESVESVDMRRLDSVEHPAIAQASRIFLKLDVQGYEMEVLEGASGLLDSVCGFQVECSLTPLYENQALYQEIIDWIASRGYALWAVVPGFGDQKTGRMLQMDGVFFRDEGART